MAKNDWVVKFEVTQPFHGPGGAPGDADVIFAPGHQFDDEAAIPVGVDYRPVPVQVPAPAERGTARHAGKDTGK